MNLRNISMLPLLIGPFMLLWFLWALSTTEYIVISLVTILLYVLSDFYENKRYKVGKAFFGRAVSWTMRCAIFFGGVYFHEFLGMFLVIVAEREFLDWYCRKRNSA